ncbi:MAG: hypothetical protein K9K84_05135 [Methylovulum sp.]|jgi:hypothetical protein|nr:hypothetical protein [Methylovulum sp.]
MTASKNATREAFLKQGAELIQDELEEQANLSVGLQQEIELKNVDLLSSSLIANKNIHSNIKAKVQEYSQNIQKILYATAHFIEKEKFESVDKAINEIEMSKFDKNRLLKLVDAQKNLSFSYSTLSAVIEIFKMANKSILDEISKVGFADSTEKRLNKTALYLKNAIIVYELTSFVVDYVSSFQLNGINDIKVIQQEVYRDIEKGHKDDEDLRKQVNKGSNEKLRDMMYLEIEQRNGMRKSIKAKWENMLQQIDGQAKTVDQAKNFISDLKIIRDNAKNKIDILNITATTALVENSINMVSELASNMQDWALPPLDEKTACELLGLEF